MAATRGTWARLWHDLAAAPEFYRERRSQPLELALAVAEVALSITLVTTLVSGVAAFATALLPWVRLNGLATMAALTATVAYFYGRRLQWSGVIMREWIILLAPSIVVWRLITLLSQGTAPGDTLRTWLTDPASLFDGAFGLGSALLILAWAQGLFYGRNLADLHPAPSQPMARPEPGTTAYWLADEQRRARYLPPPTAIVAHWLKWGLVLAIVSALGAAGLRHEISGPALLRLVTLGAPDESAALPDLLVYMLCGLVLVGLAQLSRLRANWSADGVTVMPGLSQRALWALVAVVLVSLAAALPLPTRYAIGLGDLLVTFAYVAHLLSAVLLALLLAPLGALLALLLGQSHPLAQHGSARPIIVPPALPPGIGIGAIIQSLLFWGVALAVLTYCGAMLWRQTRRPGPAHGLTRRIAAMALSPLRWLARVLWGRLRQGMAGATRLAHRLSSSRQGYSVGPLRHPSVANAGPRERVAYLYLSIEERARSLGFPRRSGQTASEYSRRLSEQIPDLDPDLRGLTALFLEARYSPHSFDDERAAGARSLWKRVRSRLRARRPQHPSSDP